LYKQKRPSKYSKLFEYLLGRSSGAQWRRMHREFSSYPIPIRQKSKFGQKLLKFFHQRNSMAQKSLQFFPQILTFFGYRILLHCTPERGSTEFLVSIPTSTSLLQIRSTGR